VRTRERRRELSRARQWLRPARHSALASRPGGDRAQSRDRGRARLLKQLENEYAAFQTLFQLLDAKRSTPSHHSHSRHCATSRPLVLQLTPKMASSTASNTYAEDVDLKSFASNPQARPQNVLASPPRHRPQLFIAIHKTFITLALTIIRLR